MNGDLSRYARDIHKGVRAINLRTQLNPAIWEETRKTLAGGSEDALATLLRETVDKTLGLLSGSSPMGAQATELLLGMQAQALAWTRARQKPEIGSHAGGHTLAGWLARHEELLVRWTHPDSPAQPPFGECDMTQLAGVLAPEARRSAAAPFVAAVAVLGESMNLFTDAHEDCARFTSSRAQGAH